MKKLFLKSLTVALAGVVMAVSISGCETARDEYGNEYYDDNFVELKSDLYYRIVYDKNTKVKYFILKTSDHENGITPLYNADGSLQIYKGNE